MNSSVPDMASRNTVPPLLGGGRMGRHVRETDWAATPLGDFSTWPQSLRSALSLVLNAKGIAALYWGADQWLLYNDAYGIALGDRHPAAFGRPMQQMLTDIAPVLGPQVAEVLRTGEGFAIENQLLVMHRHGRDEETVWTYSFSPVQGESGEFAGVLLLTTEITRQRTAERSEEQTRARLETALKVAKLGTYEWHAATATFSSPPGQKRGAMIKRPGVASASALKCGYGQPPLASGCRAMKGRLERNLKFGGRLTIASKRCILLLLSL